MKTTVTSTVISKNEISELHLKELNDPGYFDYCLKNLPQNIFLPEDLKVFLDRENETYWRLEYAQKPYGPSYIKTAIKSSIKWIDIEITIGLKNVYVGSGVNLISGATEYCAPGMLIYIPEIKFYGNYDIDHGVLNVFPGFNWSQIIENVGAYVWTQWQKPGKDTLHKKISNPYDYKQLIKC